MSGSFIPGLRWRLPPVGALGLVAVAFWLVVAVLAPWITPYPPGRVVDPDVLGPMTWPFPRH